MPTWLVTGAEGMLGRELVALLHGVGEPVVPTSRAVLDVTEARAVDAAVSSIVRTAGGESQVRAIVVNLAAWTDVDAAEVDEPGARLVNVTGAANVARACRRAGARMIQLSTDYVFDGESDQPYAEDAPVAPATAYGRTKVEAEREVTDALPDTGVVLRTGWLYGVHGPNFVRTMVRMSDERPYVDVVNDQRGQPTWAFDLAERIVDVGRLLDASGIAGVLHATNSGSTTWYGLARAVFAERGLDPDRVRPVGSDRMPRLTPRPAYSVLGHDRWARIGLAPMRPWRTALAAAAPTVLSGD
ncbi:dTDP-4-dehydrorhamnose reductase [Haloactinopolyspora alba]|uniref:dTDP-4-dehydrorhamnose reductase n=1 Tax=Haloactinopolyspora alba TaxID=648780 RepID=A0A2P8E5G4_9ACTN|nr:dTDP-4-dehydrorhamnose reductase [Haloactinopolyspora alba]PSL04715.1 dTDP-4-dehydrorhamnose reductase [Haloactinopolyspora alba]